MERKNVKPEMKMNSQIHYSNSEQYKKFHFSLITFSLVSYDGKCKYRINFRVHKIKLIKIEAAAKATPQNNEIKIVK